MSCIRTNKGKGLNMNSMRLEGVPGFLSKGAGPSAGSLGWSLMSGGSLNSSWGSWGGLQVCLQVVSIVWWGTLAFYGWGVGTEARGDPMLVLHWYM